MPAQHSSIDRPHSVSSLSLCTGNQRRKVASCRGAHHRREQQAVVGSIRLNSMAGKQTVLKVVHSESEGQATSNAEGSVVSPSKTDHDPRHTGPETKRSASNSVFAACSATWDRLPTDRGPVHVLGFE